MIVKVFFILSKENCSKEGKQTICLGWYFQNVMIICMVAVSY